MNQPIQLFDPASSTYSYLLADEATNSALLIDPVDAQIERDLAALRERGLKLRWIVETHVHADHITSAARLAVRTGARTAAPAACGASGATRFLRDGEQLFFGAQRLQALHTPGHTAGSTSYVWESRPQVHVFTGDTLLIGGCGRTDFQSGNARALYASITDVLFALPDDAIVWPGHDYRGRAHSTIGQEKTDNERIAGKREEEFVRLMDSLQLARPARMDEAIPANLRMGRL